MMQRLIAPVLALAGLGALVAGYIMLPHAAAAGWLVAFDFSAGVVLGSLGLALVAAITGGDWYAALAPVSAPAALLVPALLVALVPVFASEALLFHWNAVRPQVGELWSNLPGHVARSIVLLAALSAVMLLRGGSKAWAAGGLVLYAFAFSVFAIDWVYAIAAQSMYTGFGAFLAVSNLATALAFAILLAPRQAQATARDQGGILIAMVLGSLYLEFMDFMIAWYGDVPARIAWYALRATWPWPVLLWAALIFGAFGPLFVLLASRTRFVSLPLRAIATSILIGAFAYDAWLIVPAFGWAALGFAGAGVLLLGSLGVSFVAVRARRMAPA